MPASVHHLERVPEGDYIKADNKYYQRVGYAPGGLYNPQLSKGRPAFALVKEANLDPTKVTNAKTQWIDNPVAGYQDFTVQDITSMGSLISNQYTSGGAINEAAYTGALEGAGVPRSNALPPGATQNNPQGGDLKAGLQPGNLVANLLNPSVYGQPPLDSGTVSKKLAESSTTMPEETGGRVGYNITEQIKSLLGGTGQAPAAPSLASQYQSMRQQAGVVDAETELNTANTDLKALQDEILTRKEKITGAAGVSSRYIGRELVNLDAKTSEALRIAENRVSEARTMVNNRNQTLSTLMSLTQQDYQNAVSQYNSQISHALQIYGLFSQEQNRTADNARASLKLIQDAIKDGSVDPNNLTDEQNQTIQNLEVQAGEPLGITKFIQTNIDAKIFWKGVETDEVGNKNLVVVPQKADGTPDMENIYKIVVGKGQPSGTDTSKLLSITEVANYKELYPNAGVDSGDTIATANAKVAALSQPKDYWDEDLRKIARANKAANTTYEEAIAGIDADPTIKNKDRAKLIMGEIYKINKEKQPGLLSRIFGGGGQKTEWKPAGTVNLENSTEQYFGDLNSQILDFNKNYLGQQ